MRVLSVNITKLVGISNVHDQSPMAGRAAGLEVNLTDSFQSALQSVNRLKTRISQLRNQKL